MKLKITHLLLPLFTLLQLFANAQTTVHSETFDTGLGSWTAVDITDNTDVWTQSAGEATMNGYGGADDEDWLISPLIDMDAQDFEYFMFDYNDGFGGPLLELYYSTDYNNGGTPADVNAANWIAIPLRILDLNTISCFTSLLHRHPAIDLDAITGNVYFAFKYSGTSANSKSYRIDNVHIESNYYGSVVTAIENGASCESLKTTIHNQIKIQQDVIQYTSSNFDVWDALLHTDRRTNDAGTAEIVWDMFTDIPSGTGEYEFDHCSNRDQGSCPNGEGQCYNREHTFPRSWWGGGTSYPTDTQNVDLHHITPSDRLMNTWKLNYPPGNVTNASNTGSNGFKVGSNPSYPCSGMNYFEPIDEFKGDYARMFFYMATRYESQIAGWAGITNEGDCALDGTSYPAFEPFMLQVLLEWDALDPVSDKEIDRNNAIYAIQGNRNPFIDNPEWIHYIWGDELGNTCSDLTPTPCIANSGSESVTACDTYTWTANGQTYTTSGNYQATLTNVDGCDSTATLNLTINNSSIGTETIVACESYTWTTNGMNYTTSGNYTATIPNTVGCDSVVTLNLTINQPTTGTETVSACESYTWTTNGSTYTSSGSYTAVITGSNGCDSTVTLDLTINASTSGNESIDACESYTWPTSGQTYTTSGDYTHTLMNAQGCDSIVTLHLMINQTTAGSESITACDSYTWSANGQTYTTSGNYQTTLTGANGCDSIATLNLTINQSTSGTESVSACQSYTWPTNGQTYTATGDYQATITNAAGCDSTVTLQLTINQPTTGSEDVTACNSYTWSANGQTYSSTGSYSTTLQGSNGCDSTATLNLTISTTALGEETISACEAYTWSANGQTYVTSGDYSHTLVSTQGCDSIVTLHLTINQTTAGSESITACDSYTWSANGQTYTTSGNYQTTLTGANGCDSVATLNLTINQSTSGTESVSACQSYTWSTNGQTYTVTGDYQATITNAAGCDSTVTLQLTINQPTTGSEDVTACNSYTWSANGQTYSSTGSYSTTLQGSNGCDSTATLNLTISNTVTGEETISACSTFTWTTNGQTYLTSGDYTHTLASTQGCDSIVTLHLTINQPTSGDETVTACDSYTWSANGQTYTTSGNYQTTLTGANGCDSVVTLSLTINTINTNVLVGSGSLTADQSGATYQWIDCNNGNAPLNGETDQTFTPAQNGSYAVILTMNECTDTSNCILVEDVGLNELQIQWSVYPNPFQEQFAVEFGQNTTGQLRIIDSKGAIVYTSDVKNEALIIIDTAIERGYYILEFIDVDSNKTSTKIVKQ